MHPQLFTPGSRIEVRDAEWRIKRIDRTTDGGEALVCEGLSELVLGRETTFLSKLEPQIRVLEPEKTQLVDDPSSQYRASRLYLDTLMRNTVPTDDRIYAGQHAALDLLPYQFEPARQALRQPRQRILIADAVGLGKTLEAGILVSELIARGKGKRILVLAVKAMLTQFQQEFWNRFSIGLTRLDSQGLQRVRNRIPANHNPFHHFDRAIISIDTLKQDIEYRHYLEQAYWDIIIIDEAHNVAERSSRSQRARLAKLLATRSDTLIMLTATPHDGKPESFASLVNMLNPTAIANPSDYQSNDYRDKGLVIRRFKADIRDQLSTSFPDRDINTLNAQASPAEEALYAALAKSSFQTLRGTGAGQLFRTTLMKALFSSPAALLSTLDNRLKRLANRQEKTTDPQLQQQIEHDTEQLEELRHHCLFIDQASFSKYRLLVDTIKNGTWDASLADDRLVIFTESIPTLEFLHQHLPRACKLKKNQVALLRGDMSDRELADTVNSFNQKQSPLRLLLCSDVASEGINLHHLSHRMIHFDIPWSLMVFQQRNGRIDRYGQTRQPLIRYLLTDSQHPKIQGDTRILEVLINKDQQAGKNIGDPSEFSVEEGEARTAAAMEAELLNPAADPEATPAMPDIKEIDFMAFFNDAGQSDTPAHDPLAAFIPAPPVQTGNHPVRAGLPREMNDNHSAQMASHPVRGGLSPEMADNHLATRPRLFDNDFDYARNALAWLQDERNITLDLQQENNTLWLTAPEDLRLRRYQLPREAWPEHGKFVLSTDLDRINSELKRCREAEDSAWPAVHYLWPQHPVMEWLDDRMLGAFGRHTAPVIRLPQQLEQDEHWILLQGSYPNRRGQMYLQAWCAVHIRNGQVINNLELPDFLKQLDLRQPVNPGYQLDTSALSKLLPQAIEQARKQLKAQREQHEQASNERLQVHYDALDKLKAEHQRQLDIDFAERTDTRGLQLREQKSHEIDRLFDDYLDWLENTQLTDEQPYLQVIAVFTGQTQGAAATGAQQ